MPRQLDIEKWAVAWKCLADGGTLSATGIHKGSAAGLKRLLDAGWKWSVVARRLQTEVGGLNVLLDELDGKKRKPIPMAVKPVPVAAVPVQVHEQGGEQWEQYAPEDRPKQTTSRESWAERRRKRTVSQAEHVERELATGKKLLDFGDKMLEVCSPYLTLKRKVSRHEEACRGCGSKMVVEEIHIHPSKIDVQGICAAYKEGANRIRAALNMPKHAVAMRVTDGNGEVAEYAERLNEAFKKAFRRAIDRKDIKEDVALEIWEQARFFMEGAK